jgi:uncharacterized protein YdeI (YjbR/CyaY-like superfamily)
MSTMAATEPDVIRPASRAEWRAWLAANHARTAGTWVVYPRVRSRTAGPSYEDVVEEALCFGWIDGRLRPVDDDVTSVWCSPRRPGSVWAASNRARVETLTVAGLMTPPGIAAVERARADGSWDLLKPVEALEVPPDLAAAFDRHPGARERYEEFPASQRQQVLFWVYSAKRPETRARRVELAAARMAEGLRPDRWPRGSSVE